ncbi:MAG: hypothetical protein EON90_11360 [Brevundimonas sp.]|nr:MAG: hypothetical protein EON90_11360 [Brevundimonas sp.]
MRAPSCLSLALMLVATTAQALPQTAPARPAPAAAAPDPARVARCQALAMEMVEQVQAGPVGPAMTQPRRAANTAMNLAATAARMAGGAAGAMTAEILQATAAEAQAAAEEAQLNAIAAVGDRLDGIEARMQAAGCTDAAFGAGPVAP